MAVHALVSPFKQSLTTRRCEKKSKMTRVISCEPIPVDRGYLLRASCRQMSSRVISVETNNWLRAQTIGRLSVAFNQPCTLIILTQGSFLHATITFQSRLRVQVSPFPFIIQESRQNLNYVQNTQTRSQFWPPHSFARSIGESLEKAHVKTMSESRHWSIALVVSCAYASIHPRICPWLFILESPSPLIHQCFGSWQVSTWNWESHFILTTRIMIHWLRSNWRGSLVIFGVEINYGG